MYPHFAEKLLWGGKVVGVKVTLAIAVASAVKSLLQAAWQHKASRAAVPAAPASTKPKPK